MPDSIQISDAAVLVNNEVVAYLPNTLVFTEGGGEQKVRTVVVGNGKVETVFSDNAESKIGMVKFEMAVTHETIKLVRSWKKLKNRNVVQIVAVNDEGETTRTFSGSGVINNPEVGVGSETSIPVEFNGNPPV